jgi:hypothetical protein
VRLIPLFNILVVAHNLDPALKILLRFTPSAALEIQLGLGNRN